MKFKKYLLIFITPLILSIFVLEIFYQINKNKNKNIADFVVNNVIENNVNKQFKTLILGDSLANNTFNNIKLNDDILDLSTISGISLAGNYFILKRFLEKSKFKPKNVYLFFVPATIAFDFLNSKLSEIYIKPIFREIDEMSMINKIDTQFYIQNNQNNFKSYILSRKNNFFIGNGYKPNQRNKHTIISKKEIKIKKDFDNGHIKNYIREGIQMMNNPPFTTSFFLEKLKQLSVENNINLYMVINPLPNEYNIAFKQSELIKIINNLNINLLNINDYYLFDDYLFRLDGSHIQGKANMYFNNLIDKYILDIY